jgi:hypothetical protein
MRWQLLDKPAWLVLKAEGEIVEQDNRGVKVLRCANGDFIKLFRVKRRITTARLWNPAQAFCHKAQQLQQRGIATVTPVALYRLLHVPRFAARYQPLAGETVRSLLQQKKFTEKHIIELAAFIALLHSKGILFRSLHPGNVVLTPAGAFGLIDILDCRFRWWNRPLNRWQRERNFQHFLRYDDGKLIEQSLRAAYEQARRVK